MKHSSESQRQHRGRNSQSFEADDPGQHTKKPKQVSAQNKRSLLWGGKQILIIEVGNTVTGFKNPGIQKEVGQ